MTYNGIPQSCIVPEESWTSKLVVDDDIKDVRQSKQCARTVSHIDVPQGHA